MSKMCLVPTTAIQELANEITQKYPDASKRNHFSLDMCAEWIGLYNDAHQKTPDNVPSLTSLVNYIEKTRNKEGKSFLRDLKAEEKQKVSPNNYEEIPVELMGNIADEEETATMYDYLPSSDAQLTEKFGNKTETTVSEILNNLLKYNSPFSAFIKAMQNNLGELGDINIKLVPNSYSTVHNLAGAYNPFDNTIYINRNASFKGKNGKVDNTIIHELVHAIVANSLNTQKHREELGKIFNEAREKIFKKYGVNSFEELPENLRRGRLYGLQNLDEFSAEFFTNSEFILELNDEDTFGKRSDRNSIISKLVEWIKSLLPKGVTDTYKRSGEILEDILLNSGGTIQSRDRRNSLEKITINQSNNRLNKQIEYGNDFRRVQETVRTSGKGVQSTSFDGHLSEDVRQRLARVLRDELRSQHSTLLNRPRTDLTGKGNLFAIHKEVDPQLFHDVFEIARFYTPNGELVDLHDDYSNCKCYLNEDGTCGFAIEPDGNLISVFSLGTKRGFLWAIKDFAIAEGANHLDAYASEKQNLRSIYEKAFGAKVASSMDYNMEYDHDSIAENHSSPQVVFMVLGKAAEGKVIERHFNKDQYDDAETYQHSYLPQTSLASPQASTRINIYAGTGENADLSNFAERPFKLTPKLENELEEAVGFTIFGDDLYSDTVIYNSVEQAFQDAKIAFAYDGTQDAIDDDTADRISKSIRKASSAEAKRLGKNIPMSKLAIENWDKNSSKVMKILLKESFKQNPQALQRLLATGNATLTHTQDKGKWGTEFPRLLMEVRKELMGTSKQQSRSTVSTLFKQGIETLAGYYEGGGRLITDDFPGVPEELDDKLNNHFMGGEELSDADYYELNKYVRVIKNPDPNVVGAPYIAVPRQQQASNTSAQSSDSSTSQSEESASFNITPQELAEIQEKQKNNPPSNTSIARPISPSFETALKVPTSEQKDFYTAFSPNQMVDRAKMITSMFSDIIDKTIRERKGYYEGIIEDSNSTKEQKEKAEKALETFNDPVLARVAAVDYKTYSGILDDIKKQLRTRGLIARNPEVKQKLQNTVKYFDLLVNEAVKWIEQEEGIPRHNEKTSEETDQDNEDFGDNEEGNASNGNDGWISRDRYINPFRGLSKQVKRVLNGIASGEYDDLGNSKTYTQGFVYSALMSYLSKNIESPDDFMTLTRENDYSEGDVDIEGLPITKTLYPYGYPHFPALEKMAVKYPWAKQVIARLTKDWRVEDAEDGTQLKFPPTYGSLASQFYTNFRKAFIPYAKVQIGINPKDGKPYFGTTPLNYDMEERSQRDELENSYNNGITYSPDSVYNADKTLNIENAKKVRDEIEKYINGDKLAYLYTAFNDSDAFGYEVEDEYKKQRDEILNLIKAFGINLTKENVESLIKEDENAASLKSMLADLREIANQIAGKTADKNYFVNIVDRYNKSVWDSFFKGRGFVTEVNLMQSFYDPASKKTMYSYSGDNYLQRTMRFLFSNNISKERRQQYLDEHFGNYEWFRDQKAPKGQGWKSLWLEHAYNANNLREGLPYMNINSIDEITDGEHVVRPYNNWTEEDKYHVVLRSYDSNSDDFGYYLSPIFADSPMSMCVRGPKFTYEQLITGTYDESGKFVPSGFMRIIDQELQRIKYIREDRAKAIKEGRVKAISNYEKNGSKFCIIPELNDEVFGPYGNMSFAEYITQLRDEYEGAPAGDLDAAIQEAEIQAINYVLDQKLNQWLLEMPENIIAELGGDIEDPLSLKEKMRVQYYNMVYAAAQIVELTTVDTAFYKNSTDFQKRFKEVYASGIRLNTNSRFGRKAGRVAIIADEEVTSRSYNNIKAVIDKAGDRINKKDHDFILSCFAFLKDKKQGGINVSDAQALRSLSSLRSVLDMMGKWDKRTEAAYTRIKNGTWNRDDFDIVLQTLKPFVYSVIARNDGKGGQIPVPIQHKNSELVMLAMYDFICGGLKNSAKMRGINKFLEEATDNDGNPIVDMIQFESAGKAGNQGVININYSHKKVQDTVRSASIELTDKKGIITDTIFLDDKKFKKNTRSNSADNFDEIKTQLTHKLIDGDITQETFNRCMDYFQPTEEEVLETLRTYTTDRNGNINQEVIQEIPFEDYMIAQPTPEHHMDAKAPQGSQGRNIIVADLPEGFELALQGKGKRLENFRKEEIVEFYYNLIVENLLQDYAELKDIFKDKKSLRDKVMELAQSNPTYGSNFAEAFSLDSDGNFILSPNSPTIFNKVQQLVNSVIKNHIAVQKVNGAALIQASGIGLSDELNLVFDKIGKPVGAECYLPATSRRFFEAFMKKERINGQLVDVLDIEALHKAKLDKAIGYRIPTENKSSMLPIIIKGFSPQQNGSTIFLPAEITALSGSDFDVDKMFLMLSDFYVVSYDKQSARRDYARTNALFGDVLNGLMKAGNISQEDLKSDEDQDWEDEAFKEWWKKNKENYRLEKPEIHIVEYDFSKTPKENGKRARNTMLVQIMYKILTSQEGAENMFNPQHFEDVKESSKMMQIMHDNSLLRKYMEKNNLTIDTVGEHLMKASEKDLEDFVKDNDVERSPIYPQTFNYFHEQNMAGDALLAMFALQVSATAKFQRASIIIKPQNRFTINGREIKDVDKIFNGLGEHRLKNVSQFVGACADNGKDPNVTNFGATRQNAKVIAYMLRAGLSIKEAALVVNQPIMQLPKYKIFKLTGQERKYWKDSNVSSETLVKAILQPEQVSPEETIAIAIMCYKILEQAENLAELTSISRADSPNGGIAETFAKARLYKYKVDLYNGRQNSYDFPFYPIKEAISNTKIDLSKSEDEIRQQLQAEEMSMLQGFYSLGVQSFDSLLSPFFFMLDKEFDDKVVKKVLNNLPDDMSDDAKEKVLNALYNDFITFSLSEFALFGDENDDSTMKSKRDYYLNEFPLEFSRILHNNPAIRDLIGTLITPSTYSGKLRLVFQNGSQRGQKEDIMRSITGLLYMQNPEDQEVANKLVKDLFIYSYFDNGLQFTADSFSTLFSTQLCTQINGYNEFLQQLGKNLDNKKIENFHMQFLNNHPEIAVNADRKVRSSDSIDNNITINAHQNHKFGNPLEAGVRPYEFINYKGIIYSLQSWDNDYITYTPVPRFGDSPKLYNAKKSINEMADDYKYMPKVDETDVWDDFNNWEADQAFMAEQAFLNNANPDFNDATQTNVPMNSQEKPTPTNEPSVQNAEQSNTSRYTESGLNQLGNTPC